GSPRPSHRISKGSSAIFGIGNVAAISGVPIASATAKNPTATPMAIPRTLPMTKPHARRWRLAPRCTSLHRLGTRPLQRHDEPGHGVEQRGLAATRRPEQGDELPRAHAEAHVAERVHGMALMIDVGLRHPIDDDAHQRRRKRWIFPVAVFGRSSTTSMRSGIL